MKKGIHPTWHTNCIVTCACGNTFQTGSTYTTLQVDICSACHPFFTGEMKFVDTQGRVDRFMQKMKAAQSKQQTKKSKKAKNISEDSTNNVPKTYKQLLQEQKTVVKKSGSSSAKSQATQDDTTPASAS